MAPFPLLITASASLVATVCFILVAIALRRRRYSPELRRAGQAYVLWWSMFAFQAFTDALRVLLALQEPINVDLYVTLAALKIIAAGIGVWALARYVLFLWNGKRWVTFPILAFAVAHAAYFLSGLNKGLPAQVHVDTWAPRLELMGPGTGLPGGPLVFFFYFLPPIVLAITYLALRRRMETREQKIRVTSIAMSILIFQVVGTIQFNPATPADSPLFALLPLISAAVGLLVLATFSPPAWMTRRFGIQGISTTPAPAEQTETTAR